MAESASAVSGRPSVSPVAAEPAGYAYSVALHSVNNKGDGGGDMTMSLPLVGSGSFPNGSGVHGSKALSQGTRSRRKAGAPNTVKLYFREPGSASSSEVNLRLSRGATRDRLSASDATGSEVSTSRQASGVVTTADDENSGGPAGALVETLSGVVGGAVGAATDGIPAFAGFVSRNSFVMVVTVVFASFLCAEMVLLHRVNDSVVQQLHIHALQNRQLVTLASALTDQTVTKEVLAEEIQAPYRHASAIDIERAVEEMEKLQQAQNRSITTLHAKLAYPGPVEDVKFLVEQHVLYERRVQGLVRKELRWLQAHSTARANRARLKRGRHSVLELLVERPCVPGSPEGGTPVTSGEEDAPDQSSPLGVGGERRSDDSDGGVLGSSHAPRGASPRSAPVESVTFVSSHNGGAVLGEEVVSTLPETTVQLSLSWLLSNRPVVLLIAFGLLFLFFRA